MLWRSRFILAGILSATFLLSYCSAGRGFVKDQNEDAIVFPPITLQNFESKVPTGHLRPLGWQSEPRGEVTEAMTMPTPKEFHDGFVKPRIPVVFRNVIETTSAAKNWQRNKYLIDKYGPIPVDVVVKKQLLRKGPQRMKLQKFVMEFNYEDWYLSNYVPHEMMHELVLPSILTCGFRRWLMESELWMSSGGTSSLLHSHADHDLHCLVSGRKDFIFIESKYKEIFKVIDHAPFIEAGHSPIDMDMINMYKSPKIGEVPWTWSTLRAGDCIFVPAGYLHQVRSYGRSISSTNHFAPTPDIDFADCADIQQPAANILLSDAGFMWSYIDGRLMLNSTKLDAELMRHYLLKVMRNSSLLTSDIFQSFYEEVMDAADDDYPAVEDVWEFLSSGSEHLTRQDIKALDASKLAEVAEVFNLPWELIRRKATIRHTEL
jgi:lysine-specific demethylase 8